MVLSAWDACKLRPNFTSNTSYGGGDTELGVHTLGPMSEFKECWSELEAFNMLFPYCATFENNNPAISESLDHFMIGFKYMRNLASLRLVFTGIVFDIALFEKMSEAVFLPCLHAVEFEGSGVCKSKDLRLFLSEPPIHDSIPSPRKSGILRGACMRFTPLFAQGSYYHVSARPPASRVLGRFGRHC